MFLTLHNHYCFLFQIIANNLQTVEKLIVDLEDKVLPATLQQYRKAAVNEVRLDNDLVLNVTNGVTDSTSDDKNISDVQCCKAITVAIVRASLQDLNVTFVSLKEIKERKESVKVFLKGTTCKYSNLAK